MPTIATPPFALGPPIPTSTPLVRAATILAALPVLSIVVILAVDLDLNVLGRLVIAVVVFTKVLVAPVVAYSDPDLLAAYVRIAGQLLHWEAAGAALAVLVVVELTGIVRLLRRLVNTQVARIDVVLAVTAVRVVHSEVLLVVPLLNLDDDVELEFLGAAVVLLVEGRVTLLLIMLVVPDLAGLPLPGAVFVTNFVVASSATLFELSRVCDVAIFELSGVCDVTIFELWRLRELARVVIGFVWTIRALVLVLVSVTMSAITATTAAWSCEGGCGYQAENGDKRELHDGLYVVYCSN